MITDLYSMQTINNTTEMNTTAKVSDNAQLTLNMKQSRD